MIIWVKKQYVFPLHLPHLYPLQNVRIIRKLPMLGVSPLEPQVRVGQLSLSPIDQYAWVVVLRRGCSTLLEPPAPNRRGGVSPRVAPTSLIKGGGVPHRQWGGDWTVTPWGQTGRNCRGWTVGGPTWGRAVTAGRAVLSVAGHCCHCAYFFVKWHVASAIDAASRHVQTWGHI